MSGNKAVKYLQFKYTLSFFSGAWYAISSMGEKVIASILHKELYVLEFCSLVVPVGSR